MTEAEARVEGKLEQAGVIELVGHANLFGTLSGALAICRQPVEADPAMARGRTVVFSESVESVRQADGEYHGR